MNTADTLEALGPSPITVPFNVECPLLYPSLIQQVNTEFTAIASNISKKLGILSTLVNNGNQKKACCPGRDGGSY